MNLRGAQKFSSGGQSVVHLRSWVDMLARFCNLGWHGPWSVLLINCFTEVLIANKFFPPKKHAVARSLSHWFTNKKKNTIAYQQCAISGIVRCDEEALWGSGEEATPGFPNPHIKNWGGSQRHYSNWKAILFISQAFFAKSFKYFEGTLNGDFTLANKQGKKEIKIKTTVYRYQIIGYLKLLEWLNSLLFLIVFKG